MGKVGLWELLQHRKEDELTNKENAIEVESINIMIWQKCSVGESENNIECGLKKLAVTSQMRAVLPILISTNCANHVDWLSGHLKSIQAFSLVANDRWYRGRPSFTCIKLSKLERSREVSVLNKFRILTLVFNG